MYDARISHREKDVWSGLTMISVSPQTPPSKLQWASHATNNWILLLSLEGAGTVLFDDQKCEVNKADFILIRPNTPHSYQSSCYWRLLWFHFPLAADVLDTLIWPETNLHWRKLTLSPRIFLTVKLLLTEANTLNLDRRRNWYMMMMRLIESAILRADSGITEQGRKLPEWVTLAIEQLDNTGLDIDKLAKKFGFSRASFYTKFKELTGYSPGVYRELRKLRQAEQRLLQTNANIAQIAYQSGYNNPLYFSMRFRKYYGVSPKNYRQKHAATAKQLL